MQLTEDEMNYVAAALSSLGDLEEKFAKGAIPTEFCLEGKIYRNHEVIGKIKWDELSESYVFKPNKKYFSK